MPAYLIVDNQITDPKAYDEYRRRVVPLLGRFGGRFLVRGGQISHLEGEWKPQRLVIVEFPVTVMATVPLPEGELPPLPTFNVTLGLTVSVPLESDTAVVELLLRVVPAPAETGFVLERGRFGVWLLGPAGALFGVLLDEDSQNPMLAAPQVFDLHHVQPVRCRNPIRRTADLLNAQCHICRFK